MSPPSISGRCDWTYIIIGIAIGSLIGAVSALKVKMTSMPEMVGLFNGFGGGASVLVAGSALVATFNAVGSGTADGSLQMKVATVLSGIIGSVTFFGIYVAFGKLAEFLCVKWKLHTWQKVIKYGFSAAVAGGGIWYGVVDGDRHVLSVLLHGLRRSLIAGLLLLKKDRFPGMDLLKGLSAIASVVLGVMLVLDPSNIGPVLGARRRRRRPRRRAHPVDRRRRHAGRDRPAELLLGPGRGGHRLRHQQHRADHRRFAGRRLGHHPHQASCARR